MEKGFLINYLQQNLSEARFQHSIGVAEAAEHLAIINGADAEKAYQAGLLHDLARRYSHEEIVASLERNAMDLDKEDYLVPETLHGRLSALLVSQELHITDPLVLQAIVRHTTGAEGMTVLDAVVFLADMIEPSRTYLGVQELRATVEKDLYVGLVAGIKQTLIYLLNNRMYIHPRTIQTYNWLLAQGKLAN